MSVRFLCCALAALMVATSAPVRAEDDRFTIAVIPDTQFYVDYLHQTEAGFPFDAREMLYDQMAFIARNAQSQGGDIAFATMVGDVWEHPTARMDADHRARGFRDIPSYLTDDPKLRPDERTRTVEMPIARRAFGMLVGKLPFSVVPGNHDYDANWSDARWPLPADPKNPGTHPFPYGMLAYGGLNNFNAVFGADTAFFRNQPWYVAHHNGGANSAQLFTAGGYRFLHIGLEMAPSDEVLAWATSVIKAHPGLPTIVTTHDHLDREGQRKPLSAVDFKAVDPRHNNPEDVWRKFIAQNDQIFLVLSGHQYGQSHRSDSNSMGHEVCQVLADYQDRHQALIAADPARAGKPIGIANGIGDGWLRLMRFDFSKPVPVIRVSTYSTYYKADAAQLPAYAAFYKADEKPTLDDKSFVAEDEFSISLQDFRKRFRIETRENH